MRVTAFLVCAMALAAVVYAYALLQYHYRVPSPIEMLQCEVEDFHADMLRDRQPLVCRGTHRLPAVAEYALAHAEPGGESETGDDALYGAMRVAPALCSPAPPRLRRAGAEAGERIERGWYAAAATVQLRGERRLTLFLPDTATANARVGALHRSESPRPADAVPIVEVVLRLGDALYVPSGWWVGHASASADSLACDLQWNYALPYALHAPLSRLA